MAQGDTQAANLYETMIAQAISASAAGDAARAMSILEDIVAAEPELAKAHWLLGAEYAQVGRPVEAEVHFAKVLTLDPTVPVARFQLGLLQLTCGRALDAAQTWGGLDLLPNGHPLVFFKNGMLSMSKGELDMAMQTLQAGLSAQPAMPEIAADMRKVLAEIEKARGDDVPVVLPLPGAEAKKEEPVYDEEQVAALLSRYREDSA